MSRLSASNTVKLFSGGIGLLMLGAVAAGAADSPAGTANPAAAPTNPIIGKWEERFPNGSAMVTDFTATTIASTPTDTHGTPTDAPIIAQISYQHLGQDAHGDSYAINFLAANGKPSGQIVKAYMKNADTLEMNFPGGETHTLNRFGSLPAGTR